VDEKDKCKKCMGKKLATQKTELEVAVEPGCPNEHVYILHGMGDEAPGVMAGDIHVRVLIEKHKVFTR